MLIILINIKISAQEIDLPQYINHMADNPFLISPSYAGIGSGFQLRLNGVSQWIGIKNAPDTQSITVEGRFTDVFAGGLTLFSDKNGATHQNGAKGSLAYHLTLSDFSDSFFSFALSANYTQFNIGVTGFEGKEKQFLSNNYTKDMLNFDISILYRYRKFAISFNALNILNKKIKPLKKVKSEVLRKYSLYTLSTFKISEQVEIEPSIYIDYFEQSKRSETDLNIKVRKRIRNGYMWAGLSYSFFNDKFGTPIGVAPLVGLKKNKIYFSYGIGITTNRIAKFNYGTHMITLGFDYDPRPSLARCTKKMIML